MKNRHRWSIFCVAYTQIVIKTKVYTTHPSSVELEKIATKFIEVYPSAVDQVPGGKPYVSGWLMNC